MMFTVLGRSFRQFIASKSEISILRPPLRTLTRELLHPPGPFKVDKLSKKHRFQSFLVSLN